MLLTRPKPHQVQAPQWVQRIRLGDEAAFESLFRAFAPGLCAFLGRYVESRAVAEDLVQDLFLTLWHKREELQITGTVDSYLFGAARNRALNYLRHERVTDRFRTSILERGEPHGSSEEGEILEMLEVQGAVETLPARCRLIFSLHHHHGLTYAEIARSLGLSVKTVETQMGRALKALRTWVRTQAQAL
jgi:RNA polymerase sigma-70 factor (ECF subfamily)